MHGLEPSKEFGCAPFFEAGVIGDMFRPFEEKTHFFWRVRQGTAFAPGQDDRRVDLKKIGFELNDSFWMEP